MSDAMDPVERAKQIAQSLSLGGDLQNKRSREDANHIDESRDSKRQFSRPEYGFDKPRFGLGSEERRQKDMEARQLFNGNANPGTVSKEYLIPNHMTGLIIGRGGESLKRIEATTHCKVQIPQDSSEPNRRLTIIGLPDDVERAIQMIQTMIDESENRPNLKNMGHYGPGSGPHDNNSLPPNTNQITIPIPRNIVGLIIGRHGDTIRDIAIKSGAKLNVLQNSNTDANAPISISGEQTAIDKARALIDELIANSQKQNATTQNNSNIVTRHMPVHKDLVGLVIGKKGETIRLLAEQTGCRVYVDQTEIPGTNQKNVNISGPASTIDHCQRLIEERLQASQNPRANVSHDFQQNSAQSQIADYYASQGHSLLTPPAQSHPSWDPYGNYYQNHDFNNPYFPGPTPKQSTKAIAAAVAKNPKEYIEYYAASAKAIKEMADLQDAENAKKAAAEAAVNQEEEKEEKEKEEAKMEITTEATATVEETTTEKSI
ncbi:hypothetical protein BCR36DRAFT_581889 [Piromyces finnis]|uniref:K Homology domain-containing protein n=1 Tax=Piromyces finnis TaxID=1754191 RepID=A0A1Y1VEI7_9FUNG|nr:hypothetical protein BCR36DRAFT_581889 [Piromyces finnis]|eukprot:ORX54265.1 hypothetical protein BCR36DRAFT_581889 [Piromyces finnis]